jgi:hypothetical protein
MVHLYKSELVLKVLTGLCLHKAALKSHANVHENFELVFESKILWREQRN